MNLYLRVITGRQAGFYGAQMTAVKRLVNKGNKTQRPTAGKCLFNIDDFEVEKAKIFMT